MKIMLDAGHGNQTPGKQAIDGTKEYIFNKMILNDVVAQLSRYENVTVYSCHSDSRDVPLKERTDLANRLDVDVYVSIHCNAGPAQARGIETFTYVTKPPKSVALANKVQGNMIHLTKNINRGVKTADFHVLRETNMDAILIECGFMTNGEDLKLLHNVTYRQQLALAIADGLRDVYGLKLKPVPKPVAPAPTPKPAPTGGIYKVQVGAFKNKDNAEKLLAELKAKGFSGIIIKE